MKKKFDFQPNNISTSWFRKLRIHEDFPLWKWQLSLFSFFLACIFLAGTGISSFHAFSYHMQNWSTKLSPYKNELSQPLTLQSSQKLLKNISLDITEISGKIKPFLPTQNYSFTSTTLHSLDLLAEDFLVLSNDLPTISQSISLFLQGDASLFLEYLEKRNTFLQNFQQHLLPIVPLISKFETLFASHPEIQTMLPLALEGLNQFPEFYNATTTLLGSSEPHHLLIWFQNNYEKRATGGFIGSYFDISLNDGKITQSKIRDIYELDGQIQENKETPVLAKSVVGKESWSLRDANFSPIFKESAEAFTNFYENAGGDSVDTVIAINNIFVEELLKIMGPVFIPNYNIELTSENFSFVTSYFVEGKFSSTHPKSILEEFLPLFLQKLKTLSVAELQKVFALSQKQVLAFSQKPGLEELFEKYKFGGIDEKRLSTKKLLSWYQVSISGNKSDAFIQQEIFLERKNDTYTLTLKRKHNWGEKQEKMFENLKNIFGTAKMGDELLKNILGKGSNHGVFYFFLPEDVKMLQLKTNGISLKDHQLYGKHIFELDLPLLEVGNEQNIVFQFQSDTNLELEALQK